MGQPNCPPDMYSIFGALLMIWSAATRQKLQLMNSMIGRSPYIAAPMPRPEKPVSLMGVVDDAAGAEFVEHPLADLVRPVVFGDLLAHEEDTLVGTHLLLHRLTQGLAVLDLSVVAGHERLSVGRE